MSTEETDEKFINIKLLNKKRSRSKATIRKKDKKKKSVKRITNNNVGPSILEIKEEKNIELLRQNFRHFFHVNWDDAIYLKEASRIGEFIDPNVFWFLIDNSYFIEDNIQDYIPKLNKKYLDYKIENDSHNENINGNINDSNDKNENLTSYDIYNNINNNGMNNKRIRSIMNYLSLEKHGNNCSNVFGYSSAKLALNAFKNKLKNCINIIHKINKNRINNIKRE